MGTQHAAGDSWTRRVMTLAGSGSYRRPLRHARDNNNVTHYTFYRHAAGAEGDGVRAKLIGTVDLGMYSDYFALLVPSTLPMSTLPMTRSIAIFSVI